MLSMIPYIQKCRPYYDFPIIRLPDPVSAYPEWDGISLTALQAPSWLSPCVDIDYIIHQTYPMKKAYDPCICRFALLWLYPLSDVQGDLSAQIR